MPFLLLTDKARARMTDAPHPADVKRKVLHRAYVLALGRDAEAIHLADIEQAEREAQVQ